MSNDAAELSDEDLQREYWRRQEERARRQRELEEAGRSARHRQLETSTRAEAQAAVPGLTDVQYRRLREIFVACYVEGGM